MGSIPEKRRLKADSSISSAVPAKDLDKIASLYRSLRAKYDLNPAQLISLLEQELFVPVEVFRPPLAPLEALVHHLKTRLTLSNKRISVLLDRSEKTIWQASKTVSPAREMPAESAHIVPLSVFKDRKLSILERLVSYLREEAGLRLHRIAEILQRDDSTIWTVYARSKKKRGVKNE